MIRFVGILLLFALGNTASAGRDSPQRVYSHDEWNDWVRALKGGFDEIRMTRAVHEYEKPIGIKNGVIQFEACWSLDTPLHKVEGITDSDTFVSLLVYDAKDEGVHHMCFGLFNLTFYRKGEPIARLHFAHGRYWQALAGESQLAISEWLEKKDFPIRKTIAEDPEKPSQPSEPTPAAVTLRK